MQTFVASVKTFEPSRRIDKLLMLQKNGNDGKDILRDFLNYRLEQSDVLNTVTITANYFHPIYRGKKLNQQHRQEVTKYVFEKLEAAELESFRNFSEETGALPV